jgi:glycosyltransferase involved in cell wall biosynthesis
MRGGCNMTYPYISVIMSVYNEPQNWLKKSIESILLQSFENFELIIVLDNPNNRFLKDILNFYKNKDNRIILIENEKNIGLAKSLNKALKYAKGKYIARMDADDIALRDRLKVQKEFLDKNKNVSLVGSSVYKIDENGNILGIMKPPIFNVDNFNKCEKILLSGRTLSFHPTWMVRKRVYEKLGGYRPFIVAQDYEFLLRVIDFDYKVANIKEPLLKYRISSNNLSSTKSIYQYKSAMYAIKLHNRRKKLKNDFFNEKEYLKFINTSEIMRKLHMFSTKMYVKAMNCKSKKQILKFFIFLLFSLVSPYQVRKIFNLICRSIKG